MWQYVRPHSIPIQAMTFISSIPDGGVIYIPSTEPFDFIAYLLANGWWKGNGNDYYKAGQTGGSLLITEDNQIVVHKVEYDMPRTHAEADCLLYILGKADRPAILDLVPYTPPPPVRSTNEEVRRNMRVAYYIGLNNVLKCVEFLATQFTIEMALSMDDKKRYRSLIQTVKVFIERMMPRTANTEHKDTVKRNIIDYSATLTQVAVFMAAISSKSMDTFNDDIDEVFDKYTKQDE